jgi:hypothetical protein
MTPSVATGSVIVAAGIMSILSAGCANRSEGSPDPARQGPPIAPRSAAPAAPPTAAPTPAPPEACLGVRDRGLWSDLDDQIQLALPADATAARASARVDHRHEVLILALDGFPRKAYPLGGPAELTVGDVHLALRPGDRAELAPLLTAARLTVAETPAAVDHDGDGIPDPLDVLIGAHKTAANADAYTEGYMSMSYPQGDVPRTVGVCTDVIVRAVRNAGIDLQRALHEDLRVARRAYPMVKGGGDPSIDQRRVGTLLPYFLRHWQRHGKAVDDPADPLMPGDVVFMDTFPRRDGPDHIGIVSEHLGASGLPLVINNWTDGTVTAEMDLLGWVPLTHRFRLPAELPPEAATR